MIMSLITMLTRYVHAYRQCVVPVSGVLNQRCVFAAGVGKERGAKELLLEKLFITQHTRSTNAA